MLLDLFTRSSSPSQTFSNSLAFGMTSVASKKISFQNLTKTALLTTTVAIEFVIRWMQGIFWEIIITPCCNNSHVK